LQKDAPKEHRFKHLEDEKDSWILLNTSKT
jgi:hypothetical protein